MALCKIWLEIAEPECDISAKNGLVLCKPIVSNLLYKRGTGIALNQARCAFLFLPTSATCNPLLFM